MESKAPPCCCERLGFIRVCVRVVASWDRISRRANCTERVWGGGGRERERWCGEGDFERYPINYHTAQVARIVQKPLSRMFTHLIVNPALTSLTPRSTTTTRTCVAQFKND